MKAARPSTNGFTAPMMRPLTVISSPGLAEERMVTMDFASPAGDAASTAASAGLGSLTETPAVVSVDFLPQETSRTADAINRQVVLVFILLLFYRIDSDGI